MLIVHGLAIAGTVLAATFLVPQFLRLVRGRDASGVSAVWAAFGVITNLAWVVYLALADRWVATMAPALAVVSYAAVLAVVTRIEDDRRWLRHATGLSLVFVVAASTGGLTATAPLLVIAPAVQLAPEIAAVYREARPRGVSPATWAMAAAEALCWGVYGWLVLDLALVGYGAVTSLGAFLVLGRWWLRCGPRPPLPARSRADHDLRRPRPVLEPAGG